MLWMHAAGLDIGGYIYDFTHVTGYSLWAF